MIIPKEWRDALPSPSYSVKHLKLSISQSCTRHEIGELVDSFLWISPLEDILSIKCSKKFRPDFEKIFVKVLHLSYNLETYSLCFDR
jgi:hypothetical protein